MDHFNQLTPAEDERLSLLSEECAEVIQIIAKIQRHGYESSHPADPDTSNRRLLEKELGHVEHAAARLVDAGDIASQAITGSSRQKARTIQPYLHHQIG